MTDDARQHKWQPWRDAGGDAHEIWNTFWNAVSDEHAIDDLDRLLKEHQPLGRELPLLAELIWLPEAADPDSWATGEGNTLMRLADVIVRNGSDLEARRHEGLTPLMLAAKRGNVEMVKYLIAHGSLLEARDDHGQNVLHFAADERDLQMMTLCLDAGLDPNLVDDAGQTPLHVLFDGSYPTESALTALLLSRGASAKMNDDEGLTILHLLAKDHCDNAESLRLIVGAGGDPFAVAADGSTPWSIASENQHETFRTIVRQASQAGDLGTLAIFETEAIDLVRHGEAGYYSFFADSPHPHPERLCIKTEGQWFLLTPSVATLVKVEPAEAFPDDEFYDIQFVDPAHPIAQMVRREQEQFGPGKITTKEIAVEFIARKLGFENRLPT